MLLSLPFHHFHFIIKRTSPSLFLHIYKSVLKGYDKPHRKQNRVSQFYYQIRTCQSVLAEFENLNKSYEPSNVAKMADSSDVTQVIFF